MLRRKVYGYMTYLQSKRPVTRPNIFIFLFNFTLLRHLNYNFKYQRGGRGERIVWGAGKVGIEKPEANTKKLLACGKYDRHENQDKGVARV